MKREWLAPHATYCITTMEQDGEYSFTSTMTSDENDDLVKLFRSHLMAMRAAYADHLDHESFDDDEIDRIIKLYPEITADQYHPVWVLNIHDGDEDWFTHVIVRISAYTHQDKPGFGARKISCGS